MKHKANHSHFSPASLLACILLPLYLCSCSDEIRIEPESLLGEPGNVQVLSRLRTPEEAINIAATAWHMLDDGGVISRSGGRNIELSERITIIGGLAKGRSDSSDTLMYVVNYADNEGFAIISAVRNTPEVIAVTESGNFNSEGVQSNPGLQLYLTHAKEVLSDQINDSYYSPTDSVWVYDPRQPAIQEKTVVDTMWIKRIPNRVFVKWDQGAPYNFECPYDFNVSKNCLTGCAAVAIAQAISAFKAPVSMTLDYGVYNTRIDLDWSKLCSRAFHSTTDACNADNTYPTHQRIAQILRQIGEWGSCDYGVSSSGMKKVKYKEILHDKLGYDVSSLKQVKQYNLSDALKNSSTHKTVLLVRGNNKATGSGHVWVCDASKRYKIRSRHYVKEGRFGDWEVKYTDYGPEVCCNFFNWGWGGSANGYFADLDFNAREGNNYSVSSEYMVINFY